MFADLKAAVLNELEHGTHTEAFADGARFTLNKAASMSQPTIATCTNCGSDSFTCGGCGVLVPASGAPRSLLDQDAVAQTLVTFGADVRTDHGEPAVLLGSAVDAVMELARPMPTEDQIADALNRVRDTEGRFVIPGRLLYEGAHRLLAAAVLALLNGTES